MGDISFERLAHSSHHDLEIIFRSAIIPSTESLVNYEWRGYNISPIIGLLGLQKFMKGFFLANGNIEGYNIPVQQNGLTKPWTPRPSAEHPKRFAFFTVMPINTTSHDNLYANALLLNYAASVHNGRFAVERLIRDYLAQPDHNNPYLLLGKAYLAIESGRIFSNFFIIERQRATDWNPTNR